MKINWINIALAGIAAVAIGGCDAMAQALHQGHGDHGQHKGSGKHDMKVSQADFFARLNLDEAQQKKVSALFTRLHEDLDKVHAQKGQSETQRTKSISALQKKAGTDLEQILDAKQRATFAEMGGFHGLVAGHLHAAIAKLDLTQAQKEQLHALFTETHVSAKAIQDNGSLTAEQKAQKLGELHEHAMVRAHEIIGPEQIKKLHGGMKPPTGQ